MARRAQTRTPLAVALVGLAVAGLAAAAVALTAGRDSTVAQAGAVATRPVGSLPTGATLATGGRLDSPDGRSQLLMQIDGNLVLTHRGAVVWSTGTSGHPGAVATLQRDTQLVVHSGTTTLWSNHAPSYAREVLTVRDDGVLVENAGPTSRPFVIWSSRDGVDTDVPPAGCWYAYAPLDAGGVPTRPCAGPHRATGPTPATRRSATSAPAAPSAPAETTPATTPAATTPAVTTPAVTDRATVTPPTVAPPR